MHKSIKVVRRSALKTRVDEDPNSVAALKNLKLDISNHRQRIESLESDLIFLGQMTEKTAERTLLVEQVVSELRNNADSPGNQTDPEEQQQKQPMATIQSQEEETVSDEENATSGHIQDTTDSLERDGDQDLLEQQIINSHVSLPEISVLSGRATVAPVKAIMLPPMPSQSVELLVANNNSNIKSNKIPMRVNFSQFVALQQQRQLVEQNTRVEN